MRLFMTVKKVIEVVSFQLIIILLVSGCVSNIPKSEDKPTNNRAEKSLMNHKEIGLRDEDKKYDDISNLEDYQVKYILFLKKLFESNEVDVIYSYVVYDIDKDKLPELIVTFGVCEADFNSVIYKYDKSVVREVGKFSSGHTNLYSWPGENGIMIYTAHMDNEFVRRGVLNKNSFEEIVISEKVIKPQIEEDYSDPKVFNKSAQFINCYYNKTLLPIYTCNQDITPHGSVKYNEESIVKNKFKKVLENKETVYTCSLEKFDAAKGMMSLADLLSSDSINNYYDSKFIITKYSYADINNDKEVELILRLQDSSNNSDKEYILILTLNDGVVYCYYFSEYEPFKLLENGAIVVEKYDEEFRVRGIEFYKSDGYLYYTGVNSSANTTELKWRTIESLII